MCRIIRSVEDGIFGNNQSICYDPKLMLGFDAHVQKFDLSFGLQGFGFNKFMKYWVH